jgi:hypothetical protein
MSGRPDSRERAASSGLTARTASFLLMSIELRNLGRTLPWRPYHTGVCRALPGAPIALQHHRLVPAGKPISTEAAFRLGNLLTRNRQLSRLAASRRAVVLGRSRAACVAALDVIADGEIQRHQIRTRFLGARKSLSPGFTSKAWYQASMLRTTPLTRYRTGAWESDTICWRIEASVCFSRQLWA